MLFPLWRHSAVFSPKLYENVKLSNKMPKKYENITIIVLLVSVYKSREKLCKNVPGKLKNVKKLKKLRTTKHQTYEN